MRLSCRNEKLPQPKKVAAAVFLHNKVTLLKPIVRGQSKISSSSSDLRFQGLVKSFRLHSAFSGFPND